jgi:mannan endo-1,4-beta-mannosidase
MSFLPSKLSFTTSNRVASTVLAVSLAAVGTAIYLTPGGSSSTNSTAAEAAQQHQLATPSAATAPTSPAPTTPASTHAPTPTPTHAATPKPAKTIIDVVRPPARVDVVVIKTPGPVSVKTTMKTVTVTAPPKPSVTVTVPTKAQLMAPSTKYYGLAEDGLPGSTPLLNSLDAETGKAPSLIEWFDYWDDSYSPQQVTQAWQAGALPVITWQSVPHDYTNTAQNISSYSMSNIAGGAFDKYLTTFATSIVNTGLPVGLRLDQEMNGNWYPWGAGYSGRGITNTPAQFVAAWQHIWNIFQSVGANQYVIWAWTPSRTDTLVVDATSGYAKGDTGLAEDYPGDQYVDWMGLSAYQFRPTEPATYQWIFGGTLTGNLNTSAHTGDVGLETISDKPIYIAEMGSAQTVGANTDNTANKVSWTTASLAAFLADPRIVGFVLFNNNVLGVHNVKLTDGTHITVNTDWQLDSSPDALIAFKNGISSTGYSSGLMPQPPGTVVKLIRSPN